jgi:ACR3 family arsenite transporter
MVVGVFLGRIAPEFIKTLRDIELPKGSQINLPIAILIWLMIYPMMLKVDFSSVLNVGKNPKGLLITAFVNWFVKPFSMAIIAFFFFKVFFAKIIPIDMADQYIAGTIILAAAPCTAMVFVWSYLVDGDPAYTLVQVALNDLIMLVAFAPIVGLLVSGASNLTVPMGVLFYSVIIFIVVPLSFGVLTRYILLKIKSREWFDSFIKKLHPVAVSALLLTLVLIFAFQSDNITNKWFHVILIAIPILVQVYFNSSVVYLLMKKFRVNFEIAAPGALIGASNFFELAVATAITLFGPESGAALATVVGVLVEVPVMLSVVKICKVTKGWYCKG